MSHQTIAAALSLALALAAPLARAAGSHAGGHDESAIGEPGNPNVMLVGAAERLAYCLALLKEELALLGIPLTEDERHLGGAMESFAELPRRAQLRDGVEARHLRQQSRQHR